MNEAKIYQEVRNDVEGRLREIFPNRNLSDNFDRVINFAVDDVFETSGLAEDEDYANGDIVLSCERALLYFIGEEI